jgi:hypothetical protein
MPDHRSKIFKFIAVFGSPNGGEKLAVRNWPVRVADKEAQDIVFLRAQVHTPTSESGSPFHEVDFQIAVNEDFRCGLGWRHTADGCSNKVFWPEEGYTKLDLARFYDRGLSQTPPLRSGPAAGAGTLSGWNAR